jgi:hypothetical protein
MHFTIRIPCTLSIALLCALFKSTEQTDLPGLVLLLADEADIQDLPGPSPKVLGVFQADDRALTADTFDDFVDLYDAVFINFCSSKTGICHHVAPEWDKFQNTLATHRLFAGNKRLGVAKVDCVEQPTLCRRKQIRNYPTLAYMFESGITQNYHGVLSAQHFLEIAAKNMNLTSIVAS